MANLDAPRGFLLARTGGKEVRYRTRNVDADNANALAIGDGYKIEADGNITRCGDGEAPNGIVAGFEIQAKSGEGPESIDYLPANTAGVVIGIEDSECEFEVQMADSVALTDFDAGQTVALADTAPDATLRQSRQEVDTLGGGDLSLVGLVDRIGNAAGETNAKVLVRLLAANIV